MLVHWNWHPSMGFTYEIGGEYEAVGIAGIPEIGADDAERFSPTPSTAGAPSRHSTHSESAPTAPTSPLAPDICSSGTDRRPPRRPRMTRYRPGLDRAVEPREGDGRSRGLSVSVAYKQVAADYLSSWPEPSNRVNAALDISPGNTVVAPDRVDWPGFFAVTTVAAAQSTCWVTDETRARVVELSYDDAERTHGPAPGNYAALFADLALDQAGRRRSQRDTVVSS